MSKKTLNVVLAKPRGFCAGVERAIEIVEKALIKYGPPIYVRHEIVHNSYVVEDLKRKGAIFVDEISDIPAQAVTIFSAHGVSNKVEQEAESRNLFVIDATCPLVKKVHKEVVRYDQNQRQIILIGHKDHPEVEGTSGRIESDIILVQTVEDVIRLNIKNPDKLSYVTQTTLSVNDTELIIKALKQRFPLIEGPDLRDICYATQNRQEAVKKLSNVVDAILVIGSNNSSNSNRLRDLALEMGIQSYLINGYEEIDFNWFRSLNSIGITAGASAPEKLLDQLLEMLKTNFDLNITTQEGVQENVKFKLPDILLT